MRTIPLHNGSEAIVDDADYEWLSKHHWTCCKGYAMTTWSVTNKFGMAVRRPVHMHRIITQCVTTLENNLTVDHINHNTLDNRRSNLRILTKGQNNSHRDWSKKDSSMRYISRHVTRGKFRGWVILKNVNGKTRYHGIFKSLEEAKRERDIQFPM